MIRSEHAREAELRYQYAVAAINAGDLNGAGEFIWLTVVHAVSAADPDHEQPNPDTFGNPHRAPDTERTCIPATRRIATPAFSPSDFDQCLKIAQRLHNNAYHLTHNRTSIIPHIRTGLHYANRLIRIARVATAPAPASRST